MRYALGLQIASCVLAAGLSWPSVVLPAQERTPLPTHVQPFPPLEQLLAKFADKPAFISQCHTEDGERHILIIGIGGEGRLVEMAGSDVDNAAEVKVEGTDLTSTFSLGGLWSEERLRKLPREFEGSPFQFVGTVTVDNLDRVDGARRCTSITR